MAKQLSVNLDTIRKQSKKKPFQTSGCHDENKAIITNISEQLIQMLQATADIVIDYAKGVIIMMRNSQINLPLSSCGYSYDVIVTFMGGQLVAVPREPKVA